MGLPEAGGGSTPAAPRPGQPPPQVGAGRSAGRCPADAPAAAAEPDCQRGRPVPGWSGGAGGGPGAEAAPGAALAPPLPGRDSLPGTSPGRAGGGEGPGEGARGSRSREGVGNFSGDVEGSGESVSVPHLAAAPTERHLWVGSLGAGRDEGTS